MYATPPVPTPCRHSAPSICLLCSPASRRALRAPPQVATLNKAVASALVTAGVHAKSLGLFGSWATDKRELVARDLTPPREALHAGLVPVMHGDCVADASLGGTVPSGDVVTRELAMDLGASP